MTRYIFMTGGVVSSLGKGIACSALGALLQSCGYSVRLRKLDPYLNVSPGLLSPHQHGEVFVTQDGVEADLDIGNYERFTGVPCVRSDAVTSGQIYRRVFEKERQGAYRGQTIQVIPHVTDAVKDAVRCGEGEVDFIIVEIGGTVGDIEALPLLEAVRQMKCELPRGACINVHMTLLPYVPSAGEMKTKPTQHSVKELRSIGIQPDILLCRSDRPVPGEERDKLALFCSVNRSAVLEALDADSIYNVPLTYHDAGLTRAVLDAFGMEQTEPDLARWRELRSKMHGASTRIRLGIVGCGTRTQDAHMSVVEAIRHAGASLGVAVDVDRINAEDLDDSRATGRLEGVMALLVADCDDRRGLEGCVTASRYARESRIPFLGIGLGLHAAAIDAARNLAGMSQKGVGDAGDRIIAPLNEFVPRLAEVRRTRSGDGGFVTRLGAHDVRIDRGSAVHAAYQADVVSERHRHGYVIDPAIRSGIEAVGLVVSGTSPDGALVEAVEYRRHPFFVGVQFNPEMKSSPFEPHPLFAGLVAAAAARSRHDMLDAA